MLLGKVLWWSAKEQMGVLQDNQEKEYLLLGKNIVKWALPVMREGRHVGFTSYNSLSGPVALDVFIIAKGPGTSSMTIHRDR